MSEQAPATSGRVGLERALDGRGPVHRALVAMRLRRCTALTTVRASLVIGLLTWAPLLVASLAEGLTLDGPGAFVRDSGAHVRCLFALPLLLVAERIIERRLRDALRYVEDAGLVEDAARERARRIVAEASEMQESVPAHVVLVFVVVAISAALPTLTAPLATWAHPGASAGVLGPLSIAGWINVAWSAALYRFVLLRWLFRLGVWTLFLTRLARLPLRTSAVHQDRVGGLSPVIEAHEAFGWVVLAMSSTLAARMAFEASLTREDPFDHLLSIAAFCLLVPLVCLAPTLAFVPHLERERRRGLRELAVAAAEHARLFTREHLSPDDRHPVEEADVTIEADLQPTFQRVYGAWITPFRRVHYVTIVAAAAVPMLAFFLTALPVEEVLTRLRQLLG